MTLSFGIFHQWVGLWLRQQNCQKQNLPCVTSAYKNSDSFLEICHFQDMSVITGIYLCNVAEIIWNSDLPEALWFQFSLWLAKSFECSVGHPNRKKNLSCSEQEGTQEFPAFSVRKETVVFRLELVLCPEWLDLKARICWRQNGNGEYLRGTGTYLLTKCEEVDTLLPSDHQVPRSLVQVSATCRGGPFDVRWNPQWLRCSGWGTVTRAHYLIEWMENCWWF